MMNPHLPAMPHGQPPMPTSRRQQDMPYSTAPPNMRSPPAYMGYPPHMNGHIPAYTPQQYHWYPPYPQMQPPPRPFQPPYAPMYVSTYPPQPAMAPAPIPPPSLHMHARTSTPLQSTMSPPVGPAPAPINMSTHSPAVPPIHPTPSPIISSSPASALEKVTAAPTSAEPFRPPLPWLSVPDRPFPARAPRKHRKNRALQSSVSVELPAKEASHDDKQGEVKPVESHARTPLSEPQTPTLSGAPSVANSTQPTTPSSAVQPSVRPVPQAKGSKPAVPVVPVVPVVPGSNAARQGPKEDTSRSTETSTPGVSTNGTNGTTGDIPLVSPAEQPGNDNLDEPTKPSSPSPAAPKSWADLVRNKKLAKDAATTSAPPATSNGVVKHKSECLADVLVNLGDDVSRYSDKTAFLEPRGLVNTGNMCYMNSVLQILISCMPFYRLLDHIGRRATHSFQSDFPAIDAMILFMKEFRVIDATHSEEQLKLRLKPNELEEYGDAFTPEFFYNIINKLPRFRDMRRGHQQDAQEFLGFLLEEMHEECARAVKDAPVAKTDGTGSTNEEPSEEDGESGDGWLEVGHKQKSAVTRSSGHMSYESPITRIFGGKIRSEFKVPGNKTSVTLEPYQPLQLDIGSSEINNIVDALKGLTKPESIQGDFNSSRGPNVTATKQIFIESMPPVLILHLKRFQYDSVTSGTQKIWKKIGYPLDLEIPREVLPPNKRNITVAQGGLPKYRLMGVIYHHGKNASGGHYTVDVRRQDGREWIRLDDTVIRRIRSEDVAEAGGEEDPKVLAAALEQHKRDTNTNIYDHIDDLEQSDNERGWSQVNGTGSGHSSKKSTSAITNGISATPKASSGARTPIGRYGSKDNKVAYLLFYERIA
ncbi:hypothetical protein BDV25DRAFT_106000 [Aspergillus avenaceus]|uniref:Ubiquitin carboxyl-terminal hydrolase n=1 Tax=Aspergillus avenaceus TaxID=36643 RepID=A0A5N6TXE4_ASPAV|nr:hypothetical protein BDV25DRAFT_106000 [Aspergillus avenaceus]